MPKIVVSSSADVIIDNSKDLYPDSRYSLYFYNYVNGQLRDVSSTSNSFSARLVGLSAGTEVVADSLSVSRIKTGVYAASSTGLPASALIFVDSASAKWSVTSSSYYPSVYTPVVINSITSAAYS